MKTVFLIDDDFDDREIFEETLLSLNLEVDYAEAKNGADALEKLRQSDSIKPDIIFLDLNMPIMDGRQFLKEVKRDDALKDIPVVIYSTSSNETDRQFAADYHAALFMTKQYSIQLLGMEMRQAIESFLF